MNTLFQTLVLKFVLLLDEIYVSLTILCENHF